MSDEQPSYDLPELSPELLELFGEFVNDPNESNSRAPPAVDSHSYPGHVETEYSNPSLPANLVPQMVSAQQYGQAMRPNPQGLPTTPYLPHVQQMQPAQSYSLPVPMEGYQWAQQPLQFSTPMAPSTQSGYRAQIISDEGEPVQAAWQMSAYGPRPTFDKTRMRIYDRQLPPLPARLGWPSPRAGHKKEMWRVQARQLGVPENVISAWVEATAWDDVPWNQPSPPPEQLREDQAQGTPQSPRQLRPLQPAPAPPAPPDRTAADQSRRPRQSNRRQSNQASSAGSNTANSPYWPSARRRQ